MEETALPPSDAVAASKPTEESPWFASYDDGVPHTMTYREAALFSWLDEVAEEKPGRMACHFVNTKMTYGRLRKEAEICAANLRRRGVKPGDRVGIMLPNIPQTMTAFWGVLKAGAVVTMINPLYMEKELLHQIHDAGVKHLITLDLCWPKIEKLSAQLGLEACYITTIADGLSFPLNWLQRLKTFREKKGNGVPFNGRSVLPFSVLLRGNERLSHPVENPREAIALLQYTGGTTGVSKGVILTHYNLCANTQQIGAVLRCLHGEPQTIMAAIPFFHVYGLNTCLIMPTLLGATVVPVPRFVPAELLANISKYKVSVLPGAPSIYIALLTQKKNKTYDLSSLRICISGSAPMPVESLKRFEEEFGATIIEGYGLSEASPITHLNHAGPGRRRVGSIGLPFPDTEAKIVDMELGYLPVPAGKVGELVIRGPQVMRGYWNSPDETANTLRNGWLYTGDIAVMDEEGYFSIVDRKKDMIIVGGYNVAPREIDEVLYEHPKIKEAVTVGVTHPARGEIIKAYIVLKDGMSMEKSEVVMWCRERLANYKVPRQVEFRDTLPKTVIGKILRRTLQAEETEKQRNPAHDDTECDAGES